MRFSLLSAAFLAAALALAALVLALAAAAVALGAQGVLIGRPTLWGLAAGGAAGVERVLRLLQAELAEVMAITGARRVQDIDGSVLAVAG